MGTGNGTAYRRSGMRALLLLSQASLASLALLDCPWAPWEAFAAALAGTSALTPAPRAVELAEQLFADWKPWPAGFMLCTAGVRRGWCRTLAKSCVHNLA